MPITWHSNGQIPEAIARAAELRQPLFVDFWDPTCSGCAKLLAVTYQDESVQSFLKRSFICVKYNTSRPDEHFRRLNSAFAHLWHPDLVVFDHHLKETRRVIGYLPPAELIAQLSIGAALVHLYQRRPDAALGILQGIAGGSVSEDVLAEALYWAGVAAYRVSKNFEDLTQRWNAIAQRYPSSSWALRADCLDVEIPETGFDDADPSSVRLRLSKDKVETLNEVSHA
jgi:hypothetical protein